MLNLLHTLFFLLIVLPLNKSKDFCPNCGLTRFTKNGSRLAYSDFMNNSGLSQNFNANGFHKLAANDTIGFKAYGSAHTSVSVEAIIYHTWMRITLVG